MDPLKNAHLPAQDMINQSTPQKPENQAFLNNVAATDECGLLSFFDFDLAITENLDQENKSLATESQLLHAHTDLENLEIQNEIENIALADASHQEIKDSTNDEKTALNNALISSQDEIAAQAENSAAKNENITFRAENTVANAEKIQDIAQVMQTKGAIDKAHVVRVKNGQLDLKKATDIPPDELKTAHQSGSTAFVHNSHIFLAEPFANTHGYVSGQIITYKDEQGIVRSLKVQILSQSDFKALSGLVNTHIANHPNNVEKEHNKEEKKTTEKKHEIPLKHNFAVVQLTSKHDQNDNDSRTRDAEVIIRTSSSPFKDIEAVRTDEAREREHEARKIDQLKEKLFKIIMKEVKTYEISHQNLLIDNLKNDHELTPISRQQLNSVKQRSS